MNPFRWPFASSPFERVPDAFILDRAQLWPAIRQAIEYQQQQGNVVWVIAHFADQFFEIQNWLNQWELEYQIVEKRIDPHNIADMSRNNPKAIFLGLAEFVGSGEPANRIAGEAVSISMLVIERHPLIDFDRALEAAAHQIPGRVKFGYYLSLSDPAFDGQISQTVVALLKHFGLEDNQLINSVTASRAIERWLKKSSARFDPSVRADSAKEWLAIQVARAKNADLT